MSDVIIASGLALVLFLTYAGYLVQNTNSTWYGHIYSLFVAAAVGNTFAEIIQLIITHIK